MAIKIQNEMENSPIAFVYGSVLYDEKGDIRDFEIVYVNKYFENVTGFKRENMLNNTFLEIFKQEHVKSNLLMRKMLINAINEEVAEEEIYSRSLDNWYTLRVEHDLDQPGSFKCWVINITTEKTLLKTSEEILNSKEISHKSMVRRAMKISNAKSGFLAEVNDKTNVFTIISSLTHQKNPRKTMFQNFPREGLSCQLSENEMMSLKNTNRIIIDPLKLCEKSKRANLFEKIHSISKKEQLILLKINKGKTLLAVLVLILDEHHKLCHKNSLKTYAKQLAVIFDRNASELREKKRREEQKLFESILSTVHDPISIIDLNYRYLIINNAYTRIHNKPAEEITGKKISEFYTHNDDFLTTIKPKLDLCFTGKIVKYKKWVETLNGEKRYYEICYYPRYGKSNKIIGGIIQGKDLTEEILLREKLSNVIESTDAGTWERNLLTGEAFLNEKWANMLGYTLAELQPLNNMTWRSRIHPDDLDKVNKALARHYRRKIDHYECEFRMRHKTGHWIWVQAKGKVLEWTETGKPLKMFGTQIDISSRKKAEEKLIRSRNLMQSIVDTLPGTLNVMDSEYRIIAFNRMNERYINMGYDDINTTIGKKCYEVFMNRKSPCSWCKVPNALKTKKTYTDITNNADPREKVFGGASKIFISPICDPDGTITGAVEYSLDISDLQKAKETAERLKRQKEEFFTHMSHDLRTPVNSIMGYSEMLRERLCEPNQTTYLNNIINTSNNLLQIIKNILEYSKADTGKLDFHAEKTDLYELLNSTVELIKPLLNENTKFSLSVDKNIPKYIKTDIRKLEHILINLLSNAVKFTEKGFITLSANLISETDTLSTIEIAVTDTGIGIEKGAQKTITNSFNQANHSIQKKYGGSGLGLSVVSKFLNLFNSHLCLESTPGKGSRFSFVFSSEIIEKNTIQEDILTEVENYSTLGERTFKVLIAEDNDINILLLDAMIKRDFKNAIIDIAKNGEKAIELYHKKQPDIIFMDINMPLLSGYDATRRIRQSAISPSPSIIGFTASSITEVFEKALNAGMNECITKPVTAEKIRKIIIKYL